jgi:hypothetical protein
MIGEGDCGAICGMKIGRGNRSTLRKLAPAPLCPPQIPLDQTRDRTRAAGFLPRRPGFCHVGFVVYKVAIRQILSKYFGFSWQSSFHQILHHHNHPGQATIGQLVAAVPSGPSWTPPPLSEFKEMLTNAAIYMAKLLFPFTFALYG